MPSGEGGPAGYTTRWVRIVAWPTTAAALIGVSYLSIRISVVVSTVIALSWAALRGWEYASAVRLRNYACKRAIDTAVSYKDRMEASERVSRILGGPGQIMPAVAAD